MPTAPDPQQLNPDKAQPAHIAPLDRKRLLTAFALAPLLSGFYPAILLAEPAIMPISLVLAYATAAVLGIPLVAVFSRRGVRAWWLYGLGGAACSIPTIIVYALIRTPQHFEPFGVLPLLQVLCWGACSGVLFWMLGVAGDSPVGIRTLFDPLPRKK